MKSIRVKLIVPFLVGLISLALFLSWYTYTSATSAVEKAVLIVSEAKTNQVDTSMVFLFRSMLSTVQNIVVDPHVTSFFAENEKNMALEKSTSEWVEILVQGNDYYREIFITDGEGRCVVSSNPGYVGRSFAAMPSVKKALGGMFTLDDFSVGLITRNLSSTAAGPVDMGGSIVGAIVMICDFPRIVSYETDLESESGTIFTALLGPDGLFEAHRDRALMGNGKMLFPDLYAQLQEMGRQGGMVRYVLQGKPYIGYAKLEPVSKWIVISSGLESEVFASAYHVGFVVFGVSLLVLCLISFVVVRFANGILDSLISLINYAKRVSEGQIDLALENTDRDDELGVLHQSLKRVVETLQSMLFQTQEVSRMKGEFLANMSHEIRTPINAIIGMAHLALRDESMSSKQRNYIEKIQIAARSLLGVINDILDISKIEAGKLVLENASFDLRQLLEDTFAIHQINAYTKSLDLTLKCGDDIPQFLIGDSLRIGQVLNNLLSNAIKFTQDGEITLNCVLLDREADEASIRISVSDTGIGLSRESIDTLFQPFTQADASITRRYGGTGLGLAISKSILQLMRSSLEVESRLEKGSTFSFTLRLKVDASPSGERKPDAPTEEDFRRLGLEDKVILIAEDNQINQVILEELIAPSKATILLAENGQQAVDMVRENEVDLVFMDMQMPVMDGLQATRAIRVFADAASLPIIAVTANAMKEDKEKVFASGMNEYISKPVELGQLYSTLRTWLSSSSLRNVMKPGEAAEGMEEF